MDSQHFSSADTASDSTAAPLPFRLTLETNPDQCNLKCVFCQVHSPYATLAATGGPAPAELVRPNPAGRQLAIGTVRRVVGELGTALREIAVSTMGEPLLYEHMPELIDLCRSQHIPLNLTTNGTFPRLGPAAWAARLAHVAADVKISLNATDAATQARLMIGSRWDQVVENLRIFLRVRNDLAQREPGRRVCTVTLKVVFMEDNVAQLPGLVALARELGVDRVRGHHLLPLFAPLTEQSLDRDAASRNRWNDMIRRCHAEAVRPDGSSLRLDNFTPLGEPRRAGRCPFLGREAFLTVDGHLVPCCVPQDILQHLGNFGSVAEHGLVALWNGSAYRNFVEHMHPLCADCALRSE